MQQVLAGHDGTVFVCGIAQNIDELLDLFDRVFLLHIDRPTQEARLITHDALHPPEAKRRQEIRNGLAVFEAQMLRLGAIALDRTEPTGSVANQNSRSRPGYPKKQCPDHARTP